MICDCRSTQARDPWSNASRAHCATSRRSVIRVYKAYVKYGSPSKQGTQLVRSQHPPAYLFPTMQAVSPDNVYTLEDRTALISSSDFDDIYDRLFLRVSRPSKAASTMIYKMKHRSSRHRDSQPLTAEPIVVLDFAPDESLGNISFPKAKVTVPMARYLRKTSLFGGYVSGTEPFIVGPDGLAILDLCPGSLLVLMGGSTRGIGAACRGRSGL